MAKKSKQRKSASTRTRSTEDGAGPMLGNVLIPVQCTISVAPLAQFDELVIEWQCLGLTEEPDTITEVSGNSGLLDVRRPPYTDGDGLHVFFNPPLSGQTQYGFQFLFTYNEASEAKSNPVKTDFEYAKEREEREKAAASE